MNDENDKDRSGEVEIKAIVTPEPITVQLGATNPTIVVGTRHYLSYYHLAAAVNFTKSSLHLESEFLANNNEYPVGDEEGKLATFFEHRGYVTASIISSFAFLEAALNELLINVLDGEAAYVQQLDGDTTRLLSGVLEIIEEKNLSILAKYRLAATLAGHEFDTGREPYQSAANVSRLRNDLVHYRPTKTQKNIFDGKTLQERMEADPSRHQWSEDALRSKFQHNPLYNPLFKSTAPIFFPDQCLGSDCARWAIESCLRTYLKIKLVSV